jgi:diaminopimelate decarboxylase
VGIGSGWNEQNTTGGIDSSFGIYDKKEKIDNLLAKHNLTLSTVHLHIGSGINPDLQKKALSAALEKVKDYPSVNTLNIGGGFKVARTPREHGTDIDEMGLVISEALIDFERQTGRKIGLEVEPGTALVANAGYIVTKIVDVKDTGPNGRHFLVVDGGMNMNARPALYAAVHPLYVVSSDGIERDIRNYSVVGINCESGDLLTPQAGRPGVMTSMPLRVAEVGDLLVIGGTGAYTSGMALEHYNSQQAGREVMVEPDDTFYEARRQEPVHEIWRHETGLRRRYRR